MTNRFVYRRDEIDREGWGLITVFTVLEGDGHEMAQCEREIDAQTIVEALNQLAEGEAAGKEPAPAAGYSDAEKNAWWIGWADGQGEDPQNTEYANPFVGEGQPLVDAWAAGFKAATSRAS